MNLVTPDTLLPSWVSTTKLIAKPDQLIKRQGKAGLLALNKNWADAKNWILKRVGKPQKVFIFSFLFLFLLSKPIFQVESVTGTLNCFIVEPFVPHPSEAEYYICITSSHHADTLLFTTGGGVDVGDVNARPLNSTYPSSVHSPPALNFKISSFMMSRNIRKRSSLISSLGCMLSTSGKMVFSIIRYCCYNSYK